MKTLTIEEAIDIMLNSEDDFAVRGDDYIPVKSFRKSCYHGDDTVKFQLPGVSAIFIPAPSKDYLIDAVNKASNYGAHVFLLSGIQRNALACYHDPDEVIMLKNKVVGEIIL